MEDFDRRICEHNPVIGQCSTCKYSIADCRCRDESVDVLEYFKKLERDIDHRAKVKISGLGMDLAEEIKKQREKKGLSQRQMAILMKTQQSRVAQIEDVNYGKFTLLTLAKVADALGMDLRVDLVERPNKEQSISQEEK